MKNLVRIFYLLSLPLLSPSLIGKGMDDKINEFFDSFNTRANNSDPTYINSQLGVHFLGGGGTVRTGVYDFCVGAVWQSVTITPSSRGSTVAHDEIAVKSEPARGDVSHSVLSRLSACMHGVLTLSRRKFIQPLLLTTVPQSSGGRGQST